jgi:hypothetical protein
MEQVSVCKFGMSFSLKQCRDFEINPKDTLNFLIEDLGFRRFRLMSYWNEHEKSPGSYSFNELDWQIEMIEKAGGEVSLCLGARQPRWPESHYPQWALNLSRDEMIPALLKFNKEVIKRYSARKSVISWQLENEALNRGFGLNGNFDRQRLNLEMDQLRSLSVKPVIMSTSNTWGIPIRKPRPDIFGFTLYRIQYSKNGYKRSKLPIIWYKARAFLIKLITRKNCFIHELQMEPWGPKGTQNLSRSEQEKSMSHKQLKFNLEFARKTNLFPIDLWGGEWLFWRKVKFSDQETWKLAKDLFEV